MRRLAIKALDGVGDATAGEWHEFTGYAYHLRRRLTAEEAAISGDVCDLRGTPEATQRLEAIRAALPARAIDLALEEMAI